MLDTNIRKHVVLGIIFLFIGTSVIQVVYGNAEANHLYSPNVNLEANRISLKNTSNNIKGNLDSILCPAEFDPVDELLISWPKKSGDESYECEPFSVQVVKAAEDAVHVNINVNKYWMFNIEASETGFII